MLNLTVCLASSACTTATPSTKFTFSAVAPSGSCLSTFWAPTHCDGSGSQPAPSKVSVVAPLHSARCLGSSCHNLSGSSPFATQSRWTSPSKVSSCWWSLLKEQPLEVPKRGNRGNREEWPNRVDQPVASELSNFPAGSCSHSVSGQLIFHPPWPQGLSQPLRLCL